jgi:PAS domain S-box-containing protein
MILDALTSLRSAVVRWPVNLQRRHDLHDYSPISANREVSEAMNQQLQVAILVVDDDSSARSLLRYSLQREGYLVYEARDGAQSLDLYTQVQPDIVLLDALMPGWDGFEICARLRAAPRGEEVAILITTALDDTKSIDRAFLAGATDYITKPVNQSVLKHRIRRLLLAKQAEKELDEHRHHLEKLVEERTAELTRSNEALQQDILERERIEKELERRAELEKLVANMAAHFINLDPAEIDEGLTFVLRTIAQFAGAERGYAFVFSDDGSTMTNTSEWCAERLEPQRAALKDIPVQPYGWWMEMLATQEIIYIPSIDRLPAKASAERRFFQGRQVKSLMAVPMVYKGAVVGFIGFDSVGTDVEWPIDFSVLLTITSEIIVNALERKRTEEALYRSEQKLRQITDTMLDSVYQTNAGGFVEYASPSCWDLLGYSPEMMLGMSIYTRMHPEDMERVKEAVHTVGQVEYRYQHADGHYVWLETLSNLLFGEDGSVEGIVFASRDITERKRVEHEAQELNRLKTEFLSTAAHELRTPLTSIRGFSEILLTRQLAPDRQQRYLKLINDQSTQLGSLIDDLLDLSRLEAKRNLTLNLQPVDLSELLQQVALPFVESMATHTLRMELLPDCPLVNADPFRLGQVIKNLLSNAVKYSAQGSVITVDSAVIDGQVRVGIRDQGIGMTPEQLAHLFEKFYRADASNMAVGGTGLGLAISKLIVELHGGKIWAESEYGISSTFYFTLPLNQPSGGETHSEA